MIATSQKKGAAYPFLHGPVALVFTICPNDSSHKIFLVPLSSVAPHYVDSVDTSMKQWHSKVRTAHMSKFNKTYGSDTYKSLFKLLLDNKLIKYVVHDKTADDASPKASWCVLLASRMRHLERDTSTPNFSLP